MCCKDSSTCENSCWVGNQPRNLLGVFRKPAQLLDKGSRPATLWSQALKRICAVKPPVEVRAPCNYFLDQVTLSMRLLRRNCCLICCRSCRKTWKKKNECQRIKVQKIFAVSQLFSKRLHTVDGSEIRRSPPGMYKTL